MKLCTPKGRLAVKRVLISNTLFSDIQRENVSLIGDGIKEFTENGILIKTENDEHKNDGDAMTEIKLDAIVYCTGFRTQEFLCSIQDGVYGKDNKHLQKDVWNTNNCFAYKGVHVTGFPNLFMLYGPGTNLVHASVIFMIEQATNYTIKCIKKMMLNGWNEIDVKESVMREFVDKLDEGNKDNAWQFDSQSNWYKNDKGRGSTNWAWSCNYYWWIMRDIDWNAYHTASIN